MAEASLHSDGTGLVSFGARARVVDLLGREQIADVGTALSELIKNAVDAGASKAMVDFWPVQKCLIIKDDGLGMSYEDMTKRWLMLATDSKHAERERALRPGSQGYPPLGEKGIGRLSVAALGSIALVYTRQAGPSSVAHLVLVAWDLFRHPLLSLDKIPIPITTISEKGLRPQDLRNTVASLARWTMSNRSLFSGDTRSHLRKIIKNLKRVRSDHERLIDLLRIESHGTAFAVLDTSLETEDMFTREVGEKAHTGEELISNPDMRLLLGFSDPFRKEERRIDLDILVEGNSLMEDASFWEPEDFQNVDHEFEIDVDERGFATGRVRRKAEWFDFEHQIPVARSRSSFPGPFKIKVGYVEGEPKNSSLSKELFLSYTKRLNAYGSLYVYRDLIRVLPYGRTDNDFLDFEYRRSLNAGTYFFSSRRMFGAVYITSRNDPELRDKAGREGFMRNGAYRGFRESLIDIFVELAGLYFGTRAGRTDKPTKSGAADKARLKLEQELKAFEENLSIWNRRLPSLQSKFEESLAEARNELKSYRGKTVDAKIAGRIDLSLKNLRIEREGALDQLGQIRPKTPLSTQVQKKFDTYLSRRSIFENKTQQDLEEQVRLADQVLATWLKARERIERFSKFLADVINSATNEVSKEVDSFKTACRDLETEWADQIKVRHLEELKNSVDIFLDKREAEQIILEEGDEAMVLAEAAASAVRRRLREVVLPFWHLAQSHVDLSLDPSVGEFAIASLAERVTALEERDRMLAELAQVGLVTEGLDHDYRQLFSDVERDLQKLLELEPTKVQERLIGQLEGRFRSLEFNLSLLEPLYRRPSARLESVSGHDIRHFIETLMPQDSRDDLKIQYGQKFLNVVLEDVRKELVLGAIYNVVHNARYWTTRASTPRTIRFSLDGDSIVISNSGPAISERDRERIFEPFVSRKPTGRGLGLYLARLNLGETGLRIYVSANPTPNALKGANFVIGRTDNETHS
jgi:signal transduction histidine kinase